MGNGAGCLAGRILTPMPPHDRPDYTGSPDYPGTTTDRLMRSSKSRSRNKSNRQRSLGNIVNRVFDSSGPEGKVRGTPQQIIDKYLTLARDAQLSNDRVAEQSFLQHAEHYTRMLSEAQREMAERQAQHQQNQQNQQNNHQNRHNNGDDRDGGPRDQANRDGDQPRMDGSDQPRSDALEAEKAGEGKAPRGRGRRPAGGDKPVAAAASDEQIEMGLPDVKSLQEGDEALVDTPETEKPARKATRARTPRSTAPRTRRKPKADELDADAPSAAPQDGGPESA